MFNPRTEQDNLGTMVSFHRKYGLGDDHNYHSTDFSGWDEIESQIQKDTGGAIILPLWMYDHSGITISVRLEDRWPDHRWDCMQFGFIYVSRAKAREEYGVKLISPKLKARIEGYLEAEVEEYDAYLNEEGE
jgi:hypothetical protein